MKILLIFLLALTALIANFGVARACSCPSPPAPKIALQKADAVFLAQTLSEQKTAEYQKTFTFEIIRSWKGDDAGRVEVVTASNGAICGVDFQIGEKYLIYASRRDKVLNASLCSRTRHINSAAADIAELNDPRPVGPQPEPEQVLRSSPAPGEMERPLQDLLAALKENPKATRFRLFWHIGWQLTTNPPSGEKGSVTAFYDREKSTFKFYASYLRYKDQSSQRHIKHRVYEGVTPELLKQLAAKYQDSDEPLTNFSFFDRLPEIGATATDLGSKIKAR